MIFILEYNHTYANLALIPLFAQAPNKITAMGAESGLTKKSSHKFVRVDLMDAPLHGASAVFFREPAFPFLELPDGLGLFFLGGPLQFYFHM